MPKTPSNTIILLPMRKKTKSQKIAAILNLSNVYQNSGRITEAIDLIRKNNPNRKT